MGDFASKLCLPKGMVGIFPLVYLRYTCGIVSSPLLLVIPQISRPISLLRQKRMPVASIHAAESGPRPHRTPHDHPTKGDSLLDF